MDLTGTTAGGVGRKALANRPTLKSVTRVTHFRNCLRLILITLRSFLGSANVLQHTRNQEVTREIGGNEATPPMFRSQLSCFPRILCYSQNDDVIAVRAILMHEAATNYVVVNLDGRCLSKAEQRHTLPAQ